MTVNEALKKMALEWLRRSPAASCHIPLTEAWRGSPAIYLVIGTEAQIRKVGPDDMSEALDAAWRALDALLNPEGTDPAAAREQAATAWQTARLQLDKLR